MLVDQARANVKDLILAPYVGKIDQCATVLEMVQPTVTVIRELAKEILIDHHLYLSTIANPQEESKELVDDLGWTVKMLQKAITLKNEKNVQQVTNIETQR
jgi:hypothetical protein